jgi:hypothetical protein
MKMHGGVRSVDQTTLRKEELTVNSAHKNMTVQSRPAVQAAVHKSRKLSCVLTGPNRKSGQHRDRAKGTGGHRCLASGAHGGIGNGTWDIDAFSHCRCYGNWALCA